MKLLFGFLLAVCIGLFAYLQWGGLLLGGAKNGQAMADLNADKIKLLAMSAVKLGTGSAVPTLQQVQVVSTLPEVSAPAASAALQASAPAMGAVSAPAVIAAPVHATAPAAVPATGAAPPKKVAENVCMEWGEFSGTDLKQATQALAEMKLGNRLGQREVEYDSGYWVAMHPLKGMTAVKRKIGELKDLGIEDHFVVQMPGHQVYAISLGVFKTRDAAESFFEALRKKGVRTAKVGERKSRLKFTVFTLKHIDAEAVAHLEKLKKDLLNSELKSVACK